MFLSLKNIISMTLVASGIMKYLLPEFTGIFGSPIKTSIEHRELIGVILFVSGVILFYIPKDMKN